MDVSAENTDVSKNGLQSLYTPIQGLWWGKKPFSKQNIDIDLFNTFI